MSLKKGRRVTQKQTIDSKGGEMVQKLESLVQSGELFSLITYLDKLSPEDVQTILNQAPTCNALLLAMERGEEEMCMYLLEKGLGSVQEGTDIQALRNQNLERNVWDCAGDLPKIQHWIYQMARGERLPGERKPGVPMGLERLIKKNNLLAIKTLLKDVKTTGDAEKIESEFEFRDPVFLAVQLGHEDIACYLIEKGFRFDQIYHKISVPGASQLDTGELSTEMLAQQMPKVSQLITDIKVGERKPGDGLNSKAPKSQVKPKPEDPKTAQHRSMAKQLQECIDKKNLTDIRKLLDSAGQDLIWAISSQAKQEPVIAAIRAKQENIALYLVEVGFSFSTPYIKEHCQCNQECYKAHGAHGKCPAQYTAVDLAAENNMLSLQRLIEDINAGLRKPGDGLHGQVLESAKQLQKAIAGGDSRAVKLVLEDVNDESSIMKLEKAFPARDPVVYSIECREEHIALYLIEKGFTCVNRYRWPNETCDQWCYYEHGSAPCPRTYTALELATKLGLAHVVSLLQNIQSGSRKPGDGLPQLQGPDLPSRPVHEPLHDTKGIAAADSSLLHTATSSARERAEALGVNYINKNGDTLLHLAILEGPELVHVAVSMGVPVNTQNFDGNSALHKAVENNKRAVAMALLINGADISLRNKMGQTPLEGSSGTLHVLLQKFKPGLAKAIQNGESGALQRLLRLWCNPNSLIKDGKTAMELATAKANSSNSIQKCYNMLKQQKSTLEMVHAVLSEDVVGLKAMLRDDIHGYININTRLMDKHGETPLSCAISQRNLEIVQLLVDTGRCQCEIRVPESHQGNRTTLPVLFKTIDPQCPVEIWRFLKDYCSQSLEKDKQGNTPLLRAIACGMPAKFVAEMIKADSGYNLCDRNKDGLLPRELALELQHNDVVDAIDNFILQSPGRYFLKYLPQNFYGKENMKLKTKDGQSLLDLAAVHGKEEDLMVVNKYAHLEQLACQLFTAVQEGDIKKVADLNTMNFRDKKGLNALHRAIVYDQLRSAEVLLTSRPGLKTMGDNCNRYPLHYAYALPEEQGHKFARLLLQKDPNTVEHLVDKDNREAAEYKELRDEPDIKQMLSDAANLDPYGKPVIK